MPRLVHRRQPAEHTAPLIAHVERHFGRITRGSRYAGDQGVQAALIDDCPIAGATAYVTLGLSDHILHAGSGRQYRQELLGASYARYADLVPEASLLTVAHDLLGEHRALLRGEVLGPRGPLVSGSPLEAYYCALPVYFPDALATFRGTVPATVFLWLVPISHSEAHYVWEHGWERFEELLVERDPDLLDLMRPSLV